MFRRDPLQVLVAHMGGPFWARKDERAWSFPKGLLEEHEAPLEAALREFREETGLTPPAPPYEPLGDERQASGKVVELWAVEGDLDLSGFSPGTFTMTRGGRSFEVPEVDRLAWASLEDAARLLVRGQVPFLGRLQHLVDPAATRAPAGPRAGSSHSCGRCTAEDPAGAREPCS